MKHVFSLFILLVLSLGAQAQTLKESVRGKYGEYQGSSETRIRGGKATTTYRDKYGQVTGTSETRKGAFGKTTTVYKDRYGQRTGTSTSRTKGVFSPTTLPRYIRINMVSMPEPVFIATLVMGEQLPIVTSMGR